MRKSLDDCEAQEIYYELNKVPRLCKALAEAQANHHKQMIWARKAGLALPGNFHTGAHWQHCPAMSCQRAAAALRNARP